MEEKLRQTIFDHLMTRPISSIVINSPEKDFDIALKVMAVLDYYVEKNGLYREMKQIPKLMEQLMRFRFFGSFKFYEYALKKSLFGTKLLQCESCEFIGPYITTLHHMVLSHDRHQSSMICSYCNTSPLRDHEQYYTLENCYMNYKIRQQINSNYECPPVVTDFYELVRKIASKLGVRIKRGEVFNNKAHQKNPVVIEINDDDDSSNNYDEYIHKSIICRSKKTIKLDILNDMFKDAMYYFNVPIEHLMSVVPAVETNDPNIQTDDTIQTVQTISTVPDHITATACYSDSSSSLQMAYNLPYQSPAMSSSMPSKMQQSMPSRLMPGMAPSVCAYSPPYTPPMHINDNLSPPGQMNGTNVGSMPRGTSELAKFLQFIGSTLNNISNESIRRKAKMQIQQIVLQSSAEDMNLQYQM